MVTYRAPGVYVEEIATLPASVAAVATAIPAFIGYTERAERSGEDLAYEAIEIGSMPEFEEYFGGPPRIGNGEVSLDLNSEFAVDGAEWSGNQFFLHDAVRLFFDNGGGDCYVVSVGDYDDEPELGDSSSGLQRGLDQIEAEDRPTILIFPDAVSLPDDQLANLQKKALQQCAKLKNRVAVFDLREEDGWRDGYRAFRTGIGVNNLRYGIAYTPWLKVTYSRNIRYRHLSLRLDGSPLQLSNVLTEEAALNQLEKLERAVANGDRIEGSLDALPRSYTAAYTERASAVAQAGDDEAPGAFNALIELLREMFEHIAGWHEGGDRVRGELRDEVQRRIEEDLRALLRRLIAYHRGAADASPDPLADYDETTYTDDGGLLATGSIWRPPSGDAIPAPVAPYADPAAPLAAKGASALPNMKALFNEILAAVEGIRETAAGLEQDADRALRNLAPVYERIIRGAERELSQRPPSGAIAGVYATVDRTRGVWKAPANVSLVSVSGLTHAITNDEQGDLNIDVDAGKSINAIRKFTGKGIVVWGARTLAGNDNEWRYVNVRRLFNMVQESIQRSSAWVVFESNDKRTWVRVRAMIENFLTGLWRAGALQGAKPEEAFFVKVGLGETMSMTDILEGRMIVEVGIAAVRPAEFIVLRFMHHVPE